MARLGDSGGRYFPDTTLFLLSGVGSGVRPQIAPHILRHESRDPEFSKGDEWCPNSACFAIQLIASFLRSRKNVAHDFAQASLSSLFAARLRGSHARCGRFGGRISAVVHRADALHALRRSSAALVHRERHGCCSSCHRLWRPGLQPRSWVSSRASLLTLAGDGQTARKIPPRGL